MGNGIYCANCNHKKEDHYNNFVAGTACRIKGCHCTHFDIQPATLDSIWPIIDSATNQHGDPSDPKGSAVYWKGIARKYENEILELNANLLDCNHMSKLNSYAAKIALDRAEETDAKVEELQEQVESAENALRSVAAILRDYFDDKESNPRIAMYKIDEQVDKALHPKDGETDARKA